MMASQRHDQKEKEHIEDLNCDELCVIGGKLREDSSISELAKEKINDQDCTCSLNPEKKTRKEG